MRALILDGSGAEDALAPRLVATLGEQLGARRYAVEHVPLRERRIGHCAGDFLCWVRTPGLCMKDDENRALAARVVQSDLLILLTPLTFGGYSSTLKGMVDRLIQIVMPYFTRIGGEVHHKPRYGRYPSVLAIGWLDEPEPADEAVFRHLVRRNAINLHVPTTVSDVVYRSQGSEELADRSRGWIDAVEGGVSTAVPALPASGPAPSAAGPVCRAVLLVGSPRTGKSSSASLGGYLLERLAAHGTGIQTRTFQIYTTLRSPERRATLREAVAGADLVVLAFPLYFDSLPAPVIAALERLAGGPADAARRGGGARFAAIVNCGFPEAHHCANALEVCAAFARRAGLTWAGGLALGAGEGVVHGRPLAEAGAMAAPVRRALDMAAVALAAGDPIPRPAAELMARPIIPTWLYLLVGSLGWRRAARRHGAQGLLARRPYGGQG